MQVGIQTTQNVEINYEIASVSDRVLAALIDMFIVFAYLVGCFILLLNVPELFSTALLIIMYVPAVFYHLVCEVLMNGQTFGKKQRGIRVVKLDGTQPGIGSYLLRWLLGLFERGVIGLVVLLINGKGQRLGDMAAGTTVIHIRPRVTLDDTILMAVDEEYTPTFPQVTRLSDRDAAIIKEVLDTAHRDDNRVATAVLYSKTKEFLGVESSLPPTLFLQTVLKDYNYYTGK
jgi:uncharacterized RDD family membrane protein YckC